MINYVNNSFDKVLKPCDAQQFMTLTQSEQTERLILSHRAGEKNCKAKLSAITYMGVLDEDKYRAYLRQCEEQGGKPLGSRRAEFMRPTGLLMLDFDHVGDPVKLWDCIVQRHADAGTDMARAIALAHITPSGDGLRVVLRRTKDTTIEHDQWTWCELMKLDAKPDPACKDISRLSFVPMHKEVLYYNPSLLFAPLPDAKDYPDERAPLWTHPNPPCEGGNTAIAVPVPLPLGGGWEGAYDGIPYSDIVRRLEEQLGGAPEHGARNSFIFTMACTLRYLCNDDPAWIASVLPTYGEDPQKQQRTIQSAVQRPMSREMPETMKRALKIAKMCAGGGGDESENSEFKIHNSALESFPPALPAVLPDVVELLVSRTPEHLRPAVAMSVFPPLGAHVHGLEFAYWDGRDYEPTFMNVLVAELSAGKSAVNKPIDCIISDIKTRDLIVRERMREWREQCARMKSTEDKPKRPEGLYVQILSADMTNATFVQRLLDAGENFLYTQMDEVELLDALKVSSRSGAVSAILRLAFDCGEYGQERIATNAVDARVRVRWNWNASTTVQRVRKYFAKNIADGTLSRLSFATIIKDDDDWGDMLRPVFGEYDQRFADELKPYIDRLEQTRGRLVCPEAKAWADQLSLELIGFAREIEDRTYAQFSHRAVLMGFFRAMLLYVMNDCQWTQTIADFARWSVEYDLWCKMRFFSDMIRSDLQGEKASIQRGPVSLLTLLPKEFTREDVRALRIAQGMKPDPSEMLKKWLQRGMVQKDAERNVYVRR